MNKGNGPYLAPQEREDIKATPNESLMPPPWRGAPHEDISSIYIVHVDDVFSLYG